METQTQEDLRQKQFREFEDACLAIDGTPSVIYGEETRRLCEIPQKNPTHDIILFMPRGSLMGSLRVVNKKGDKDAVGVFFEQRTTKVM